MTIEPFAFTPQSEAGADFIARIREVRPALAARAAQHDRDGTFVSANIRDLQSAGILAAAVPAELGGLGVRSPHDLAAGAFEIAQACSSTAISSWMHQGAVFGIGSVWKALADRGRRGDVARLELILAGVVDGSVVFCVAGTEPGVYGGFTFNTEASRTEDGWLINGLKSFATMSSAATIFNVALKVLEDAEPVRAGTAQVPRDAAGVEVMDDWDAMGMRGSGSGVVRFTNVRLPLEAVAVRGLLGEESNDALFNGLVSNPGLVNSALGIAQAARDRAIAELKRRVKAPTVHPQAERVAVQIAVAEMDMELMAAKALQRAHLLDVDRMHTEFTPRTASLHDLRALTAASRAAKTFVEKAAISVVNQAMSLAGGGSYVTGTDFARWYRDVRALPFMAPAATENMQFIGKVALGLEPTIDL